MIIVARGGGSMEDLWTFNEESVVRAVAACSKPVVSAVGHETDVTLCDLAADLRAPTPSAAAECVVPLKQEILARLEELKQAIGSAAGWQLERRRTALDMLGARLMLCQPERRLGAETQRLSEKREALRQAMDRRWTACEGILHQRMRELDMLSPYRVLARGYAIVTRDGQPVSAAAQLRAGDRIAIRFVDGEVGARIDEDDRQEG